MPARRPGSPSLLRLSPHEIFRLLQAEFKATEGQPELYTKVSIEHVFESDGNRRISESAEGAQRGFDRVTEVTVLTTEPRVERDYWILTIATERPLGLQPHDDRTLRHGDLSLAEFQAKLRAADRKQIKVRLYAETGAAKRHFTRWLAAIRARHAPGRKKIVRQPARRRSGAPKAKRARAPRKKPVRGR